MGRIVVTEYISVDGVVEAPSGTEPFERVGWTDDFSRGPEGDKFKLDETMASDALLLGRVTYDGFAPVWPQFEGEFADKFNTMPKYVISKTLTNPEWNNTTVLSGDLVDEVTKLKQRFEGDIVVHGSPQLAQALIEHDLVEPSTCRSTRSSSARQAPLQRNKHHQATRLTEARPSATFTSSTTSEPTTDHRRALLHGRNTDAVARRVTPSG